MIFLRTPALSASATAICQSLWFGTQFCHRQLLNPGDRILLRCAQMHRRNGSLPYELLGFMAAHSFVCACCWPLVSRHLPGSRGQNEKSLWVHCKSSSVLEMKGKAQPWAHCQHSISSFEWEYAVLPSFVEEAFLSPLCILGIFVEDQLTLCVHLILGFRFYICDTYGCPHARSVLSEFLCFL